jgi:hypothetical protein
MAAVAGRPAESATPTPLLLRFYPAAWRARYGDEFEELLASRPPGLRDRVDILFGAVDARINPQVGIDSVRETPLPRDRSVGMLFVLAGALLTAWGAIGATQMRRWESGDVVASPDLSNVAWFAGMLGSILIAVALLAIASRYDRSIGSSGAVGAVLTAAGLMFAALGGGLTALLLLGGGTTLFAWRISGKIVGTLPAVLLVVVTLLVVAAFTAFAAGGGQDLRLMWAMIAYGPAWMLVGRDLRAPIPQVQVVGVA